MPEQQPEQNLFQPISDEHLCVDGLREAQFFAPDPANEGAPPMVYLRHAGSNGEHSDPWPISQELYEEVVATKRVDDEDLLHEIVDRLPYWDHLK